MNPALRAFVNRVQNGGNYPYYFLAREQHSVRSLTFPKRVLNDTRVSQQSCSEPWGTIVLANVLCRSGSSIDGELLDST